MNRKVGLRALVVLFSASLGHGQEAGANRPAIRAVLTGQELNMSLVRTNEDVAVVSFGELAANAAVPKEAKKLFERALKEDGRGDLKHAMENLEAATQMAPAFLQAHAALAVGFLKEEKLTEAEQHMTFALKHDPHYVPAREIGGVILFLRGKSGEAVQQFKSLLKYAPNRTTIHYFLGLALWDLGDRRGAIDHLKTAEASRRQQGRSSDETLDSQGRGRHDGMSGFSIVDDGRMDSRHGLPATIHRPWP